MRGTPQMGGFHQPDRFERYPEEVAMEKWKCNVCGYIYDPEKGDPDGNIAPNTPFEKLPDDWVCPLCGAPKDMFEKA
jgi:rubredoxin